MYHMQYVWLKLLFQSFKRSQAVDFGLSKDLFEEHNLNVWPSAIWRSAHRVIKHQKWLKIDL